MTDKQNKMLRDLQKKTSWQLRYQELPGNGPVKVWLPFPGLLITIGSEGAFLDQTPAKECPEQFKDTATEESPSRV